MVALWWMHMRSLESKTSIQDCSNLQMDMLNSSYSCPLFMECDDVREPSHNNQQHKYHRASRSRLRPQVRHAPPDRALAASRLCRVGIPDCAHGQHAPPHTCAATAHRETRNPDDTITMHPAAGRRPGRTSKPNLRRGHGSRGAYSRGYDFGMSRLDPYLRRYHQWLWWTSWSHMRWRPRMRPPPRGRGAC